jgi:hypothetical protein
METVDQELLCRKEYLVAENRIFKVQLQGRLSLSDAERMTLGEIGPRLDRKALSERSARHRTEQWMKQMARNVTMEGIGALRDDRYRLHDRDTKYTASLLALIESVHVKTLRLPARSPNLNARLRADCKMNYWVGRRAGIGSCLVGNRR